MLSESQKLTIKVAVKRARENGTEDEEIKKLSGGMGIPESEIRAEADKALGASSFSQGASAAKPDAPEHKAPVTPQEPKQRRGRVLWTDRMMQQLTDLRNSGKGITEISRIMGLDSRQVQNKLSRMPLDDDSTAAPTAPPAIFTPPPTAPPPSAVPDPAPAPDPPPTKEHDEAIRVRVAAIDAAGADDPHPGKPEALSPEKYLDMPDLLSGALEVLSGRLGVKPSRVYANNNEHMFDCVFALDGVTYGLKLEVLE
jgi:hypothetical protein